MLAQANLANLAAVAVHHCPKQHRVPWAQPQRACHMAHAEQCHQLSVWGVASLLYLLACALQYRYLNNTQPPGGLAGSVAHTMRRFGV
jgi:hypothetical protein